MRKQNKIISLILVVALLFSMLVIAAPAAAAEESESFTPSATFTATKDSAGIISAVGVSGSILGTVAFSQCNDGAGMTVGILTDSETGKKFFDVKGNISSTDTYIQFWPAAAYQPIHKEATNKYYVLDFDMATYEDVTNSFGFYALSRTVQGSSGRFGTNVQGTDFMNAVNALEKGVLHHYTYALDFDNNTGYLFINGNYVKTVSNAVYGSTGATEYATEGALKFEQFRMFPNNVFDVTVANVNMRKASDVDTIASALSAKNISLWSEYGYSDYEAAYVPAFATVDGAKVYNYDAINAALADGILPAKVEFLRDCNKDITVNCDATVDTHGLDVKLNPADGVNVSVDGNVRSYDAPFKSTMSKTEVATPSAELKAQTTDSSTSYISNSTPAEQWTSVMPYLVTDVITGNKYLDVRPTEGFDTANTTHNHINYITNNTVYQANTYFITEFDVFVEYEVMKDLTIGVTSRTSANANVGGGSRSVINWGLAAGEWSHVAMIGEVNSNTLYVYVNGARVDSTSNGLWNASSGGANFVAEGGYFQGIRINMSTKTNLNANQNFAIDNVKYTMNKTDSWLASNFGGASLDGWSGNSYTLPAAPVLATVDGVPCGSVAEVEDSLFGFEAKKVEIYREYFGTITVSSDAVIQTNGFTTPVAGTGVEVSNVGTVYTYDAPYPQSQSVASFEKPGGVVTAIDEFKAATANNLFKQYQNNANDSYKMKSELVTNNYTGDTYLKVSHNTASAGDNSNAYVELQTITAVAPNSNTQYYVVDYDVALFSDVTVSCMIIPRGLDNVSTPNTYKSTWGASNPSLTSLLEGYEYGKMHHITFVYNIDANSLNVFVNNTLVKTVASGAITTAADHSTYWVEGSTKGLRLDGMRTGSTLAEGGAYALDNISIRVIEDAASGYAADSLTAALNSSNLSVWADGITEPVSETAPIATVDGEYVYSAVQLNNALTGRTHKNVEILCDLADAVTVSCDATIETNGLAVNVQGISGSTTTTEGTVITIDAPWSAPASAEKQESSVNGITAPSVAGNLVNNTTHGLANWKSNTYAETIRADKVTPVGSSETYVELTAIANKTSANHFVNVSLSGFPVNYTNYYVFDIDVASSTAFFENMNLAFVMRGAAGSSKPYDMGTKPLRDLVEADGEWHHVTVVGDTSANKMYVFVDGVLVDNERKAYESANKVDNETPSFSGVRINISTNVDMKLGDSVAIDNMALRNVTDNSITAALTSGKLTDWSGAVTDTLAEKLPSIASVNGKEYSSIQTLEAALADGNNRKVSLDKDLADYTVQMAATGTVVTNGLTNSIVAAEGYRIIDNGDGTYTVAKEDRLGTVTVTVNGSPVISAELLYGTDIVDYLYANNSFATSATAFSGDDRTVYYNASWTNAPSGEVEGDVTFACTADVFTGDFLVLNASGVKTDAAATVNAAISNGTYRTVILNKDYDFAATNIGVSGDTDVFLNGYTLTSTTTGSHIIAGTINYNLNFVGGNFVDQSRNTTHSIAFIAYRSTGTVTFNNCYIFAVANLVTLRGGNAKFVDCVIEGAQVQGGTLFQIGEYYNADGTTTNSKLEFVDTEITFSSHRYSGTLNPVFSIKGTKDYTGSGENGLLANANALGLKHVVSFDGCTIAVDHATQTPLALFQANGNTDGNSNVEINISNTVLNVNTLGTVNADVNIGDNVVSAASLLGVGTFAEGVVEIKSGVATAPFGYADEYATVTWSNGDTQLWADGTYPAHALCKDDLVTKVEAGKSYTFAATENHAGLSLKANLSLDTVLKLNVYVAVESGVTALNIGGVSYDVSEENLYTIGGVAYNKFEYELLPHRAAGDVIIAVTGADYTVAKAFNLVDYATAVYAAYNDDASRQLVANVLNYVLQAHIYKGVFSPALVNISSFLSTNAATIQAASGAVDTMSSVSAYITSAQLNLTSAPKWRFNLASGADISTLDIKVDGKTVEYKAYGSYVEIELNACDMLDTISVTIGGATGTYNLAAYCEAQTALIGSTDWNGKGQCGNDVAAGLAYTAKDLVKALYSYAYYAAAYQN